MSSNAIVVPSVGTEQVTTGSSAATRPSGTAGSIFDALQKKNAAVPSEATSQPKNQAPAVVAPAELAKAPEGSTEQALADAGKAQEAAAAVPAAAPDKKITNFRQIVKASNIPADLKEEVTSFAYHGRAAWESGMTLDAIKLFAEQGVTPASVMERVKLHPTFQDAERDSWFGSEMRRVAMDYNVDPQKFVLNLKTSAQNAPGVFAKFVETVAGLYFKDEAYPAWLAMNTDSLKTALANLGREAVSNKNEDLQTAVSMVQQSFGFTDASAAPIVPVKDARTSELEKQNAELIASQQAAVEGSKTSFLESVVTEARNTVYREIATRWQASAPAGLDELETQRAVDDIFFGVERDLQGISNFVYDLQLRRNGPLTQNAYREAVQYASDRAKPFIPLHMKSALDFWGKRALAVIQTRGNTAQQAAQQVDAADVTGATPAPAPAETPQSRLKSLRGKGLDFKDLVAQAMAGRK